MLGSLRAAFLLSITVTCCLIWERLLENGQPLPGLTILRSDYDKFEKTIF
jgi:hypothetical protein